MESILPLEESRRRILPAWVLSLAVHFVGLVAGSWFFQLAIESDTTAEASNSALRPVGIVLRPNSTPREPFAEQIEGPVASESPTSQSASPESPVDPLPSENFGRNFAAHLSLPAPASSQVTILPAHTMESLPSLSKVSPGSKSTQGPVATTSVFGVRGEGRSIVYLFDRSASMAGNPLAAAKRELLASLKSLGRENTFLVLFYNEQITWPKSQSRPIALTPASGLELTTARTFVAEMTAVGGTEHLAALRIALRLQPDALFFLTDGDEPRLQPEELRQIRQLNQQTAIHVVEFGIGPQINTSHNPLQTLASENGGHWGYVDLTKLPADE